jgi:DUF1365 family protein
LSCLYRGIVDHRRHRPVEHAFQRPICLAYLDLDALPGAFGGSWLWGVERVAPVSFRRRDHLGDPREPLAASVRALVRERTGARAEGPIRLLTQPRYLGFRFNPASFYYCFAPGGERLEFVVVEVTNTPWLERHAYVLDLRAGGAVRCAKTFHVSPFLGMAQDYRWSIAPPGEKLRLAVRCVASGETTLDAALELERIPITTRSLRREWARAPLQSARLVAAIYREAWRLYRRGAPFHPHPGRSVAHGAAPR